MIFFPDRETTLLQAQRRTEMLERLEDHGLTFLAHHLVANAVSAA